MIKYLVYMFHYCLIVYLQIPWYRYNHYFLLLVIASWKINNDYCILTQIEEKLFNNTLTCTKKAKKIPIWIKVISYTSLIVNVAYKWYYGLLI